MGAWGVLDVLRGASVEREGGVSADATGGAEAPPKCVLLFLLSDGLFIFVDRPIHGFRL